MKYKHIGPPLLRATKLIMELEAGRAVNISTHDYSYHISLRDLSLRISGRIKTVYKYHPARRYTTGQINAHTVRIFRIR